MVRLHTRLQHIRLWTRPRHKLRPRFDQAVRECLINCVNGMLAINGIGPLRRHLVLQMGDEVPGEGKAPLGRPTRIPPYSLVTKIGEQDSSPVVIC